MLTSACFPPVLPLQGHIVLTGQFINGTDLLPALQVPTTITVRRALAGCHWRRSLLLLGVVC